MKNEYTKDINDSRACADEIAIKVSAALKDQNLTVSEALELLNQVNDGRYEAERLLWRMEAHSGDEMMIELVESLVNVWSSMAESINTRLSELHER